MPQKFAFLAYIVWTMAQSDIGYGMSFQVGTLGGTFQQPTSQYYHAAYGGYVGMATEQGALQLRASYLERPKFTSAGFTDQEYGGFLLIGSQLTAGKKPYGIRGWFGAGQMRGYIKAQDPAQGLPKRGYVLSGICFQADAFYKLGVVETSFALQNFTGFVSQYEFSNRVAWPFNYFLLSLGVTI